MKRLEMIEFGLVKDLEEEVLAQTEIVRLGRLLNNYFLFICKIPLLIEYV